MTIKKNYLFGLLSFLLFACSMDDNDVDCSGMVIEAEVQEVSCYEGCNGFIEIVNIVNGTPPYTYIWNNGNTDEIVDGLCAGEYTLVVKDLEGCIANKSWLIEQPSELLVNVSSTGETSNGADGTASAYPSGGVEPYTYAWNNGGTTKTINGLSPGEYCVTVTDQNDCQNIECIMVKTFIGSFDLVIEHVKLFDGENVFENASVFVNDNKVEKILIDNENTFDAAQLMDGTGKTLIPGLIDAHVHVEDEEALSEAASYGILTLLDAFNFNPDIAAQLRQAGNEIPDLSYFYSAGIGVTIEGGILSSIPGLETVSDVSEIPAFIQKRVNEGSDYIKIMVDPNKSGNNPVLTDEMIQSCVDEAHGHNLKCIVHPGRIEDALKAAEYGADGITHIWFRDEVSATSASLAELKSSGIFVIPTANYIEKGHEDGYVAMSSSVMRTELINIYNAGIPIVAGTDAYNNRYGIGYGSGLISELEIYAEVGIPVLEVLKSATRNPSQHFDLGHKGFIKENMPADFFLVSGDPTSVISDLRNVEYVWKQGEQIVP